MAIIVSGCPRSGTSLMMDLFRVALGEERVVGSKFPRDRTPSDPHHAAIKAYMQAGHEKVTERTRKMNPNGFWECKWSVAGIQYEDEPPAPGSVVKIVSQGLARSNPEYIDKVIFMVRHPWQVANSHRDLSLSLPVARDLTNKDLGNISPAMYCGVTAAVARWIDKHSPDLIAINFDDLIANPAKTLARVAEFIGEGDWVRAADQIEPKLKRSEPKQHNSHPSWALSLAMHAKLIERDWAGVAAEYDRFREDQAGDAAPFACPRWGGVVDSLMCRNCHNDPQYRNNMIRTAMHRGIEWETKPCLWECGKRPDRENYTPLTIEQSIEQNHWLQAALRDRGLGDTVERIAKKLGVQPCAGCRGWRKRWLNKLVPYRNKGR